MMRKKNNKMLIVCIISFFTFLLYGSTFADPIINQQTINAINQNSNKAVTDAQNFNPSSQTQTNYVDNSNQANQSNFNKSESQKAADADEAAKQKAIGATNAEKKECSVQVTASTKKCSQSYSCTSLFVSHEQALLCNYNRCLQDRSSDYCECKYGKK
jgi:hypothetical protein